MLTTSRRSISYPNTTRVDAPDIPLHFQNLANILDLDVPYYTGTDAAKPAPGSVVQGSLYWATDTSILYINTGTWTALSTAASPNLSGNPTTTTQAVTDNSTRIATTAFVRSIVPAGLVQPYVGATAPAGWLLCDGSAQSRATYAALFAILGTTYGAGDGSTTFNLPDLRGRIPVGKNTATFLNLGQTGGEETHVLAATEMPSHTHAFTGSALAAHTHTLTLNAMGTHSHTFTGAALPTHTHTFTGTALGTHNHNFTGSALAGHAHTFTGSALGGHAHTFTGDTIPAHAHYMTTAAYDMSWATDFNRSSTRTGVTDIASITGGSGTNQTVMGANYGVNAWPSVTGSINSVSAGTPAGTINSVSAGTPAGSIDQQSAGTPAGTNAAISAGTPSGTMSSDSAGTPTGSLSSDSAGTPAGTNANTGGGAAHNNIQPYLVLNYIVKF